MLKKNKYIIKDNITWVWYNSFFFIVKNNNKINNENVANDDLKDCLINKNKRHLEIQPFCELMLNCSLICNISEISLLL